MRRLDLVDDWISAGKEAHYSSPSLAKVCLVSASQLRRYFQYTFGRPPQDWLNEVRIWHAMELLCARRSVKETAAELSFSTVSHFCHQYLSYHGCTPTASVFLYHQRVQRALRDNIDNEHIVRPWRIAERRLASKHARADITQTLHTVLATL